MDSNRSRANRIAVERAAGRLAAVDMRARTVLHGLPPPGADGEIRVAAYGSDIRLLPPYTGAVHADSGKLAHPVDHLLVLRYLLCDTPLDADGPPVSFRDLPGGQFYWEPFLSRTVLPLVATIGNRLDSLRQRLDGLGAAPFAGGDAGGRVACIGRLGISLAYYAGDDEFPPSAAIFFDVSVRRAFSTDDAAAMAQRLCGILCDPLAR